MLLSNKHRKAEAIILQGATVLAAKYLRRKQSSHGVRFGKAPRVRKRDTVESINICLGDNYFDRAYRMSYRSFWHLHDKLKDSIIQSVKDATISRKRARRQLQRYQRRGGGHKTPIQHSSPLHPMVKLQHPSG
jgi:hypothetical protein